MITRMNWKKKCNGFVLSPASTTGFSSSLITSVLKTCKYIFSLEDVLNLNPAFKKQHAVDILYMVRDVFEDFELDMECDFHMDSELWEDDFENGGFYEEDSPGTSGDEVSLCSTVSELSGIMELEY